MEVDEGDKGEELTGLETVLKDNGRIVVDFQVSGLCNGLMAEYFMEGQDEDFSSVHIAFFSLKELQVKICSRLWKGVWSSLR